MAFEGIHLFWKQILLGCYAALMVLRGVVMLLHPRMVLGMLRKTMKRLIEWCFRLVGRTMPRVAHHHQVLIVRSLGGTSVIAAVVLIWWLLRH